jgi:hypothetical protein
MMHNAQRSLYLVDANKTGHAGNLTALAMRLYGIYVMSDIASYVPVKNFGTMAAAPLNGAEMRGLRYLKSRSRALIKVAHSVETLWAAASGALTGDLRYESRTHPSTVPYTVASELSAMPCSALQLPVAGTGVEKPHSVETTCPARGHGERTEAGMNILERRTANRAFPLSTALITSTLGTSPASFTSSFRLTDTECNFEVFKDHAGTNDSDNQEGRWHCIREWLGQITVLICDYALSRILAYGSNLEVPARFAGAQPVVCTWDIFKCQHQFYLYDSFAWNTFECWHHSCIVYASPAAHPPA